MYLLREASTSIYVDIISSCSLLFIYQEEVLNFEWWIICESVYQTEHCIQGDALRSIKRSEVLLYHTATFSFILFYTYTGCHAGCWGYCTVLTMLCCSWSSSMGAPHSTAVQSADLLWNLKSLFFANRNYIFIFSSASDPSFPPMKPLPPV